MVQGHKNISIGFFFFYTNSDSVKVFPFLHFINNLWTAVRIRGQRKFTYHSHFKKTGDVFLV